MILSGHDSVWPPKNVTARGSMLRLMLRVEIHKNPDFIDLLRCYGAQTQEGGGGRLLHPVSCNPPRFPKLSGSNRTVANLSEP